MGSKADLGWSPKKLQSRMEKGPSLGKSRENTRTVGSLEKFCLAVGNIELFNRVKMKALSLCVFPQPLMVLRCHFT